jgi:hypothetical protein
VGRRRNGNGPRQPKAGEPERLDLTVSNVVRPTLALDRYERRALSRRKAAIRAFDAIPQAQAEIATPEF